MCVRVICRYWAYILHQSRRQKHLVDSPGLPRGEYVSFFFCLVFLTASTTKTKTPRGLPWLTPRCVCVFFVFFGMLCQQMHPRESVCVRCVCVGVGVYAYVCVCASLTPPVCLRVCCEFEPYSYWDANSFWIDCIGTPFMWGVFSLGRR